MLVLVLQHGVMLEMWHSVRLPQKAKTRVHNAKAEECTTLYMCQNIKINIGVGGSHGNQFAKIDPPI